MPGTNFNTEKANRSFATQKLEVLLPVAFKAPLQPCSGAMIFLHTPKTGGTTLWFVAQALSKENANFKVHRFAVPRVEGYSPSRIFEGWEGGLASAKPVLEKDPHFCDGINLISGHFPFGLHRYLPESASKPSYITLMRDPIEQAVSLTNFDFQRGYVDKKDAKAYLLGENIDNPQTRSLAGVQCMKGVCTAETLQQAKNNIEEYFLLAGITEDLNDFIRILASMHGWGPVAICRAQVTGEKVFTDISADLRKQLEAKHHIDIQLYAWMKQRWYAWKTEQVASFQNLNLWESQKILCIKSDFATTRIPERLLLAEVEAYNQTVSDALIEITQSHVLSEAELSKIRELLSELMPCEASVETGSPVTLILNYLHHSAALQHDKSMLEASKSPVKKVRT